MKKIMDYHTFKDIINNLYAYYAGYDKRPTFFDIEKTFPSLNQITLNFPSIKQEFENVLANTSKLPRYHDIDPGEAEISDTTQKNWNVFVLYLLGYQLEKAQALCPVLCNLVKGIPHLIQAFFSILEPGKSIPLHKGPYIGYLRYHLGIHIPKNNPPQIIINNQPYTWKEGEAVLFDDSWPHEVRNESDDFRAVLIIDVLRPMPMFPHLINQFVTQVLGRFFYGRKVVKRALQFDEDLKPLAQ
ncbi:aspartyl/asparaginyl beta-hydroxylase domain-containing protein [Legionella fairfieldensis]|uniref:aspartyl/asparaginyl beta-hydroxylase domain-containing protein n=1 Tax=Legionella fairfieldensis TaxID=45064 RepID=UPI000AD7E385|nr:aspartyl/asparaginyl beta-hydroxylase domain-containing protein [Legionella fairfieldensis]